MQPPPNEEDPLRTFIPIVMLLCSAVAGAQPAPPAAVAASNATHEVRDIASGQRMICACRSSGENAVACDQCTAVSLPSIRVTGKGKYVEDRAYWTDLTERLRGDPKVRTVLGDLEIRLDDWKLEFVIACRQAPDNRQYVRPGISMPLLPDSLMSTIRGHVERACAATSTTAAPARTEPASETTWAGCPLRDDYDRSGGQRSANRKIRIAALVRSHGDEWAALRQALIFDDLIYHCAKELLIDPEGADGSGDKATFRATVTLVCANDPKRRGEFDIGVGGMDAEVFRHFVGEQLRRICGISAATASRGMP